MPDRVKEKLVELLGANTCKHDCCEDCEYCEDRNACISYLKDSMADHLIANDVTVQCDKDINVPTKWISVKDRLPDTECLAVSMLTGPAYEEMLVGYVAEASNWDTGYECESDGEILPNVTHWMPLPQPPKGE